jgi:hypothetical protein
MQAYGSDRLRVTEDQRLVLSSRIPKRWQARTEKTLTSPEHPGTAVLWDEQYYEVIEAAALPQGGARYVLAPWKEEHAIRLADSYDQASEDRRIAEHQAALVREKRRKGANLAGLLIGHLPAVVQEALGRELGINPPRLTYLSLILPMTFIGWTVLRFVDSEMGSDPIPQWQLFMAAYLFFESGIRYWIVTSQARPVGSVAGAIIYLITYALGPKQRMVSPFAHEQGFGTLMLAPEEDQKLRDEMIMKSSYATLLSAPEQQRLAERFDFDYRQHAYGIAVFILVVAAIGTGSSVVTLRHEVRLSALTSLVVAGTLAVEQVIRLASFQHRAAGSMLAFLVRPFFKRLLQ